MTDTIMMPPDREATPPLDASADASVELSSYLFFPLPPGMEWVTSQQGEVEGDRHQQQLPGGGGSVPATYLPTSTSPTPTSSPQEEPTATTASSPSIDEAARKEAVEAAMKRLSVEQRVAIRLLFYAACPAPSFRDIFDGILLPPPLAHPSFEVPACTDGGDEGEDDGSRQEKEAASSSPPHARRSSPARKDVDPSPTTQTVPSTTDVVFSRAHVVAAAALIPPDLQVIVTTMPLNLAINCGVYDARLRAAMKRFCQLFSLNFEEVVGTREDYLASLDLEDGGPFAATGSDSKKKDSKISAFKKKVTPKRVATIGAFAVLGAAALFLTAGVAAPAIAAALGTAASATGAVAGAIGGGTAVAGIFAGIIGVGSHAAALGTLIAPILTTANISAIFGAGGAGLAGWKAAKRTAGAEHLEIRSPDDIQEMPDMASRGGDDDTGTEGALSTAALEGIIGGMVSESKVGHLLPAFNRSIAQPHIEREARSYRRIISCAVENYSPFPLKLMAATVIKGQWRYVPPGTVPPSDCTITLCHNQRRMPTGASMIMCYRCAPTDRPPVFLWILASRALTGGVSVRVQEATSFVLPTVAKKSRSDDEDEDGDAGPVATLCKQMEKSISSKVKFHGSIPLTHLSKTTIEVREAPYPLVSIRSTESTAAEAVACNLMALQGHLKDLHGTLQTRRSMTVVVENRLNRRSLTSHRHRAREGKVYKRTPVPELIPSAHGAVVIVKTGDMVGGLHLVMQWTVPEPGPGRSLAGDDDRTENTGGASPPVKKRPVSPALRDHVNTHLLNMSFDLTTVGKLSLHVGMDSDQPNLSSDTDGTFTHEECSMTVTWRVSKGQNTVYVTVKDLQSPEEIALAASNKMTLVMGISGFCTIFDPRYTTEDQQVALWKPTLRQLYGRKTEHLVFEWEPDYQQDFAELIGVDVEDAFQTTVTRKATSESSKLLIQNVGGGAAFAACRTAEAFVGAFTLPMIAVWTTDAIDNCYAVLQNRAEDAGKQLADALQSELRGNRPVTLTGFSFGANVIIHCLLALEKVGALGVVEDAYLLGATADAEPKRWRRMRKAVGGRLVNVFSRSDWFLWMLNRAHSSSLRPLAGLSRVVVNGVENLDVSAVVESHGDYGLQLRRVLSMIPSQPTPRTTSLNSAAAPGVVVPWKDAATCCLKMSNSMTKKSFVIAVVNDSPTPKEVLLCYRECSFYNCRWDFDPPAHVDVDAGEALLLGITGKASDADDDDNGEDDKESKRSKNSSAFLTLGGTTSHTFAGAILFDVVSSDGTATDDDDGSAAMSLVVLFCGNSGNTKMNATAMLRPTLQRNTLAAIAGGFGGIEEAVSGFHPTKTAQSTSELSTKDRFSADVSVLCAEDRTMIATLCGGFADDEDMLDEDEDLGATARRRQLKVLQQRSQRDLLIAIRRVFKPAPTCPIPEVEETLVKALQEECGIPKISTTLSTLLPPEVKLQPIIVFNATGKVLTYSSPSNAGAPSSRQQHFQWLLYPPCDIGIGEAAAMVNLVTNDPRVTSTTTTTTVVAAASPPPLLSVTFSCNRRSNPALTFQLSIAASGEATTSASLEETATFSATRHGEPWNIVVDAATAELSRCVTIDTKSIAGHDVSFIVLS